MKGYQKLSYSESARIATVLCPYSNKAIVGCSLLFIAPII